MKPNEIIGIIISYTQTNPGTSIAAVFIFLFFVIWKPKTLIIFICAVAAGFGLIYLFAKLSSTGLEHAKIPFLD